MPARPDSDGASIHQLALASGQGHEWRRAHELLRGGYDRGELSPGALELLAECARWTAQDGDIVDPLERAHALYTERGEGMAAARTALALVLVNDDHGRDAMAATWLRRAEELLAALPEGREHGALLLCRARECGMRGVLDEQLQHAQQALDIAAGHGDRDLEALALVEIGHVAAARGRHSEAFAAMERATAIATSGEASLYAAGNVFCNATWAFRCCGEFDRAHQWTETATRWVERQQIQYFPALCRVHRSEVLRIRGRLSEAEQESLLATRMLQQSIPRYAVLGHAELGEVRRRRGDFDGAMAAFGAALQIGWDPQPGLALVLLARGDATGAFRAIERVFTAPWPTVQAEDRASLLLARTTIAVASGRTEHGRAAADELAELATDNPTSWNQGASAEAQARLHLAGGRLEAAIGALAQARRAYADLDAPYELATTLALCGETLLRSGETGSARLELETARAIFARIGAGSERERVDGLLGSMTGTTPERATADRGPQVPAILRREGECWTLCFSGRDVRLKHGRGLDHLATLLASPGEPRWAIELAALPEAEGGRKADAGGGGELLDAEARRDYEARLRELEQELADARACADEGRVESAREEMEALAGHLAAATGLGGRGRRPAASVERARQSVTKAIRGAIERIAAVHQPLGLHLERSVRTGTSCVFDPDPRDPVAWQIQRA